MYTKKKIKLFDYTSWEMILPVHNKVTGQRPIILVVQKNGSLQHTTKINVHGINNEAEKMYYEIANKILAQVNELKIGWMVQTEVRKERNEVCYFLTIIYKPMADYKNGLVHFFRVKQKQLNVMETEINKFYNYVNKMYTSHGSCGEIIPLNVQETKKYLYSMVTLSVPQKEYSKTKTSIPKIESDLVESSMVQTVDGYFMTFIDVQEFPAEQTPHIAVAMNKMECDYRWVSRYIPVSDGACKEAYTKCCEKKVKKEIIKLASTNHVNKKRISEFDSLVYYASTIMNRGDNKECVVGNAIKIISAINKRGIFASFESDKAFDTFCCMMNENWEKSKNYRLIYTGKKYMTQEKNHVEKV